MPPFDTELKRLRDRAAELSTLGAQLRDPALDAHQQDVERISGAIARFDAMIAKCHGDGLEGSPSELSGIRHDLRALIGAVQGYAELIGEEVDEPPDILGALLSRAGSTLPLIDSLQPLALSRPSTPLFSAPDTVAEYGARYRGSTILIVDDSDDNRVLLSRRLVASGLRVLDARNGAAGFERLNEERVDLILLDVRMPGMTGPEILEHLKHDPSHSDIPVLVISAVSEVETIAHCIEAGAEDYLARPFNPIVLHARVKACLDKKLMRDLDRARMQQLREAREQLETAIESIDDGFAIYDKDGVLVRANAKYHALYPASLLNSRLEQILRMDRRAGVYFQERRGRRSAEQRAEENWVTLYLARHGAFETFSERLRDGRWIEIRTKPMPMGGVVAVHKDVTERKKDEERLTFLALHDALTGLANRTQFEAAMQMAIGSESFAVLYLDLDGFKGVNDTLGHREGDLMLQRVARSLEGEVRDDDVVARLGGDEFVALVRTEDRAAIKRIATQMGKDIAAASPEGAPVTVSIGVALHPGDGDEVSALLSAADAAMYVAKETKDAVSFHDGGS